MFGIGAGELMLIAIVILLAVGPDQMPKMIRTVGRGMRQVRRATRELQSTVGMDQLLNDEDLRGLRDPLQMKPQPVKPPGKPGTPSAPGTQAKPGSGAVVGVDKPRGRPNLALGAEDYAAEQAELGVDLELAYARAEAAAQADAADAAGTAQAETTAKPEASPSVEPSA